MGVFEKGDEEGDGGGKEGKGGLIECLLFLSLSLFSAYYV